MTESRGCRRISVVGLGKLGAPLAACYADKGHRVIGVDVDPRIVRLINEGRPPVFERGLDELLIRCRGRLTATDDYACAVAESDVTIIIVPTPSDATGAFSLRYVLSASKRIGEALRHKDGYHVVALTSTVLPGATEGEIKPVLEARSGKRYGRGFGLCYSPEFIALGSVIRDLRNPDFVLVGESDARAGDEVASLVRTIAENDPPVARMNIVNAEITKLAVNTFVTTKITFANMLARICERMADADVDVVTDALGLDSRIGRKYLRGALGYGGPCFPRDNVALRYVARRLGVQATLAEATDAVNREQVPLLTEVVKSRLPVGGSVGVLGLAYKPDTDVVEESQGLAFTQSLLDAGIPVIVYDPAASDNAKRALTGSVRFASSAAECCRDADVVVVMTAWEEFRRIGPADFDGSRRPVIVDCWRILDPWRFVECADYVALGVGRYHSR